MITENPVSHQAHQEIPNALLYEVLNGKPLYYRGYKDVLAGVSTIESVMGSSDLQGSIVSLLNAVIWNGIDRSKYRTVSNETGLQLGKGDYVSVDIGIFEKSLVPVLKGRYFDVPPSVVVEVDIKIDLDVVHEWDYVAQKTRELFQFGVQRVLWIMTKSRQVLVAAPGQDWLITDLTKDVLIIDEFSLNIQQVFDEDGLVF
ncbi:Uma2 family endonuclease [Fibrella forsythiae]|uniref:Uma2 family endonuclease n=1 Tax=Fibrella forsythiae TaxID=2817061 RepID=A0ABS3JJ46_9BACT|nr:Uma2 family endonuclease [Fibrella forsythiae]MBO0950034.1 Uma2 family endonuclease [Fibrella forsythiae]